MVDIVIYHLKLSRSQTEGQVEKGEEWKLKKWDENEKHEKIENLIRFDDFWVCQSIASHGHLSYTIVDYLFSLFHHFHDQSEAEFLRKIQRNIAHNVARHLAEINVN